MKFLQAIALAKGLDELAGAKHVAVLRHVDGKRVKLSFDVASIRSGKEPDPEIFDDDVILVEQIKAKRSLSALLKDALLFGLFGPART